MESEFYRYFNEKTDKYSLYNTHRRNRNKAIFCLAPDGRCSLLVKIYRENDFVFYWSRSVSISPPASESIAGSRLRAPYRDCMAAMPYL